MDRLTVLNILNDSNFWSKGLDTGLKRADLAGKIQQLVKVGEVVVVKGVRRSGKSTLLLQFCQELIDSKTRPEDILIVNFEDPRWRKLELASLNEIYEIYLTELQPRDKHYVILDEVQVVDGWEKFARYLLESKKVQVFVTGSSSKLLSTEYSTVLAGRHVDITVYPLSFKGFLSFKGIEANRLADISAKRHAIKKAFLEYLQWGGLPKVVLLSGEKEKRELLEAYFRDIIIKDAVMRYKIKEVEKFEELAKYYLTNVSTLQSYNRVKVPLQLSLDTVERFSAYLSSVYLLSFVKKFSYSAREQLLNPKKVYCIDSGLRKAVSFVFSEDWGKLTENLVFNELKRQELEVYYWKDYQQREVDFVVKKEKKVTQLIQVCYELSDPFTKEREIKSLVEASKELRCKNALIITSEFDGEEKHKGLKVKFIPLWRWLLKRSESDVMD